VNASPAPPLCGCGTTIDAAVNHGRKWIGIDITQLATSLIKNRLRDTYGDKIEIITVGEPVTPNEAHIPTEQDKFPFQRWGVRPFEHRNGADHGIDGQSLFTDDPKASRAEQITIKVKSSKIGV
jgi:site-specific DNA-methyltransferase (adenine-specific)